MQTIAKGIFEVKTLPQPSDHAAAGNALGRLLLDKQFHGDQGSAGYVALEIVTGTFHGHTGTFVLQHSGTMTRGTPQLSITVVRDSGTGQLANLSGKMSIDRADGKHTYSLEYTLPEAQ